MDSITVARWVTSVPFLMSGYGIAASQSTVPLLYKLPSSVSAEVFKGVYNQGAKMIAPGAIMSATAFAYLAYSIPSQRRQYTAATALVLSTQVWTGAVMLSGIHRLIEISGSAIEQQKADASGEAVKLMKAWVWQNWFRAGLSASSGLVALYAWVGSA